MNIKFFSLIEVRVRVRVPNLNPNRMYETGGKCLRGEVF